MNHLIQTLLRSTILCGVAILATSSLQAQYKWSKLDNSSSLYLNTQIASATSNDGKHAITVGRYASVYTSSDGGDSWKLNTLGAIGSLNSATYFSAQGVVVASDNGILYRSMNNGGEWQSIKLTDGIALTCVRHVMGGILLCTSANGDLFRSADEGVSWTKVHSASQPLNEVASTPDGKAMAVGRKGMVLITNDAGLTWKPAVQQAPDSVILLRVAHVRDSTWMIAGDTSYLARSTNNGASWQYIITDTTRKSRRYNVSAMTFTTGGKGVIVDYNLRNTPESDIYFTWDGGVTWKFGQNVFYDDVAERISISDIRFFSGSLKGVVSGALDRVATIRMIDDSLPIAYERRDKANTILQPSIPALFHASAGVSTFFTAIDSARMQVFSEYDAKGNLIKVWKSNDSSQRMSYTGAQRIGTNTVIIYADTAISFTSKRGRLLISSDAGATWRSTTPDANRRFNKGFWRTPFDGVIPQIIGISFYKTTDAGMTWQSSNLPTDYSQFFMENFTKDSSGYLGFGLRKNNATLDLMRSTDGLSWQVILSDIPTGTRAWKDGSTLVILGADATHLVSIAPNGSSATLTQLASTDGWASKAGMPLFVGDTLFHAGNGYDIRFSLDSGRTFRPLNDPLLRYMQGQVSPSNHRPSAFFNFGGKFLLSTAPTGVTLIGTPFDTTTSVVEQVTDIYTNPPFPNPFTTSTTIKVDWFFTVPLNSMTMKVYNSVGEEVRDLTKEFRSNAQSYASSVVFESKDLPSGVYFAVCKGGVHTSTQKLLIVR